MNRRQLILGSGAAVMAASHVLGARAAQAATALALPLATPRAEALTVNRGPATDRAVAMTFDDGPHPVWTPALLDVLRLRGIRATFYLIGNRVAQYPDIVRRIADEGHEIGNHSWSHPALSTLAAPDLLDEIDRTSEAVFAATRRIPVTLRPPYGALALEQRELIHDQRRMPTVLWSVDPEDWRKPGAEEIASRIIGHAHAGAIVLSHDIHQGTVAAMPATLDTLAARGYRFATVSMILGHPDWTTRPFRHDAPGARL